MNLIIGVLSFFLLPILIRTDNPQFISITEYNDSLHPTYAAGIQYDTLGNLIVGNIGNYDDLENVNIPYAILVSKYDSENSLIWKQNIQEPQMLICILLI